MRVWQVGGVDDGCIHVMGNGRLCAYGQGPNIVQVFGPPYSAPSLCRLTLEGDGSLVVRSERRPRAAIWAHRVESDGAPVGEMLDFADAELPVLVRRVRAHMPLHMQLVPAAEVQIVPARLEQEGVDAYLLRAPAGRFLYHNYPFPVPIDQVLAYRGAVTVTRDAGDGGLTITCGPGECSLILAGGPAYPQAVESAEAALATPVDALEARTQAWWDAYAAQRRPFAASLSANLPLRERLLAAIDDVAVLIEAQQSAEGGVLAGHNYHMAYVRDQYGASRGLLALGHHAEAQAILEFYWRIWQRYGRIHNAQAAGVDGVFHVHENDEVEITGYLIRQAFDLRAATHDDDTVRRWLPMLEWAWQAQLRHLAGGMLPFNGDETYIAGGILPRDTINDGSAEATLLLIDGGGRLLDWVAAHNAWPAGRLAEARARLQAVEGRYRANFWHGGRLLTNQPRRTALSAPPRFRHGVCERCHAERRGRGIEWTAHSATGRYLCPACLAGDAYPAAEPRAYVLQSVSLTPFYFNSALFTRAELAPLVEEIVTRYRQTGTLPSRPDGGAGSAVGYDYGLLLYALAELDHPLAAELAERTLSLLDPTGAWVEYYVDHRPAGTRCRPWESAINLEGLLQWAERAG